MTSYGFCTVEQDDVPITQDRRCIEHGEFVLAPTWVKALTPYPWPERPAGYTYCPPAYLKDYQKKATDSIGAHRKPAPKRSVSSTLDKKLRPPKPKPEAVGAYIAFTCGTCHVKVTRKRRGGYAPRFCSAACRRSLWNTARRTRPPMSAEGRACVDCGRDDRPHRDHNRCAACAQKLKRQRLRAQKAAAA